MTQISVFFASAFGLALVFTGCSEQKQESTETAPEVVVPKEESGGTVSEAVKPKASVSPKGSGIKSAGNDSTATKVEDKEPDTAAPKAAAPEQVPMKKGEAAQSGKEMATLGGGCFWCTEAVMERLEGVSDVVSGYMGGHVENPTYEQVCRKTTGHAEVIQVTFDPAVISFDELLDVFWQAHDPTTINQQGADRGPQYRSVVFYHSAAQKNAAEQSKSKLDVSAKYSDPAVTEITKADTFWVAEDGHQDYYVLNKDSNPYCRVVISPKLKKLGME